MGPTQPFSQEILLTKHCLEGESFEQQTTRIADALQDNYDHFLAFRNILRRQAFLPGGRIQSAMGAPRVVTAYNCFVSGPIEDSMDSIMEHAHEAAQTMRMGGGIGYDFSKLRPQGDIITSLDSHSSGPVSFMKIYDAVCQTIASAGHRRGAQMGVLRVDHPDIELFVRAKQNRQDLTGFNISVGVTDEFMEALAAGAREFPLRFNGRIYKTVNPQALWDEIMRSNWDWAEPGVLFLDTINQMNNLSYCEDIDATNPCGEQPLPPHGACLLGSFNLVKYLTWRDGRPAFDWHGLDNDIPVVVRAMDNVIDRTVYPLDAQRDEAVMKRRMGLGVTGLANTGEILGMPYGSDPFLDWTEKVLKRVLDGTYSASALLADKKGPFPLYDPEAYETNPWLNERLHDGTKFRIRCYGLRNSHLTSIAPTGTISLAADNVSSGIEPPYRLAYDRAVQTVDGPKIQRVYDYAYKQYGVMGKTADRVSAEDHVKVLCTAQWWVDSAVSKTCNVGPEVTFKEFQQLYMQAYMGGAKGCTTFRAAGKREGILTEAEDDTTPSDSPTAACFFDAETGERTCG